jgi:hypothetical protein
MGFHSILVFLSASFSRDLNDSFLWCCWLLSKRLDVEKGLEGREGRDMRAHAGARRSWRAHAEDIVISSGYGVYEVHIIIEGELWRVTAKK